MTTMTKFAGILGGVEETGPYTLINKIFKEQAPPVWSKNSPVYAATITFSSHDIDQLLTFLRTKSVEIENSTEIKDFLSRHDYMLSHMNNIPSKVFEYFGNSDIKLSLFRDFDSETDDPELFIEVKTSLSPEEANNRLRKIHREWFIPIGISLDKLNISLSFY